MEKTAVVGLLPTHHNRLGQNLRWASNGGLEAHAMRMLLLLLLALPAGVRGEDYRYETNGNTITITEYIGTGGAVVIPATITGLPVTIIGTKTFYQYITSNGLIKIGGLAFGFCTNLSNITIPDGVTSIESGAFFHCKSLTTVTIPNRVTNIGAAAFDSCTSLTNITIPDRVINIRALAFKNCPNLTAVYFQGNAPRLGSDVFLDATNATIYYLPTTTGWGKTFGGRPTAVWKQ